MKVVGILIVAVLVEAVIIMKLMQEYRYQMLKAELLTQIIEGKVYGDEKDIDIGKFKQGG